jgi:RNA polymerase sigma-70 factor (ECF subfamily)
MKDERDFRGTLMVDVGDMVRRYGGMVWTTAYRLVGDGVEAGDCYQEVFVAAMEVGRREEVRSWEGMLRRLATVKGLDVLRRRVKDRARRGEVEVETVTDRRGIGPDEMLERAELAEQLRWALGRVAPEQAEVFCLRHVSGMSYEDIGEQVGMTASAVGATLTRVKGKLRELMESSEVRHGQ